MSLSAATALAGLLGLPAPAGAQSDCFHDTPQLAGDPVQTDYFGTGLGMDGAWAVVGATLVDWSVSIVDAGAVYILHDDSGWSEFQKLENPAPQSQAYFGESASLSGNWAAVAAPGQDYDLFTSSAGAVNILYRDTGPFGSGDWTVAQTLTADDSGETPEAGAMFGGPVAGSHQGVAMSGSLLVVGEPYADISESNSAGRVHVFGLNGSTGDWEPHSVIEPPSPSVGGNFGYAVNTDGTKIIIGQPGANRAHVYHLVSGSWVEQDTILGGLVSNFGQSVDIDASHAIVGWNGGAAIYKFDSPDWPLLTTLSTTDTDAGSFGYAVSIEGSLAAVGGPTAFYPEIEEVCEFEGTPPQCGAVYVYSRGFLEEEEVWYEDLWLRSTCAYTPGGNDRFGETVYLDNGRLLVGSSNNEDTPSSGPSAAGAVFIYGSLPACDPE